MDFFVIGRNIIFYLFAVIILDVATSFGPQMGWVLFILFFVVIASQMND